MPKKGQTASDEAYQRVRGICLGFAGAEEKLSHGMPSFHVRGKMFLMFVDDHHADGRLAVWCKAALEDAFETAFVTQKKLVASNPARFFVPPYVGVKGWVGVFVDPDHADWIELAILVEEAWRSVAPAKVQEQGWSGSAAPRAPPPARMTTDETVARKSLERMTAICLALPEVERDRESRHAKFRAKKKVFAYFLDNHHGDGAIAACLKGDKREHARLIAKDPKRYFLPAYIGARGYLGVRLDLPKVDWKDVTGRIAASYALVMPKRRKAS